MLRNALPPMVFFVAAGFAVAQEPAKVDQAWLDKVAALKPKEQSAAIADKLRELNFKLPTAVTYKEEEDKITEFAFLGNGVRDIAPIVVLKHLKKLNIAGTVP